MTRQRVNGPQLPPAGQGRAGLDHGAHKKTRPRLRGQSRGGACVQGTPRLPAPSAAENPPSLRLSEAPPPPAPGTDPRPRPGPPGSSWGFQPRRDLFVSPEAAGKESGRPSAGPASRTAADSVPDAAPPRAPAGAVRPAHEAAQHHLHAADSPAPQGPGHRLRKGQEGVSGHRHWGSGDRLLRNRVYRARRVCGMRERERLEGRGNFKVNRQIQLVPPRSGKLWL